MIPGVRKVHGMTNRKVGVIGDVHAQDKRLEITIPFLREMGAETIICTGDVVDGPGDPNACIRLLEQHNVQTVRGNHDRWCLQDKARQVPDAHLRDDLTEESLTYLASLPTQVEVDTIRGTLLLCHGIGDNDLRKVWPGTERMPIDRSVELDSLIAGGRYRFVVNGHMHFKTIIRFESLSLINAGTISGIRWPGFSLIDFDKQLIDTFRFDESEIRHGKSTPLYSDTVEPFTNTQDFSGNWQPELLFHLPASFK